MGGGRFVFKFIKIVFGGGMWNFFYSLGVLIGNWKIGRSI